MNIPTNPTRPLSTVTDSLCDVMLGEKLPFSISFGGEEIVPAERKLTRTLIMKIASALIEDSGAVGVRRPDRLDDPELAFAPNGKKYYPDALLEKMRLFSHGPDCSWFRSCTNPPFTFRDHAVLGPVPICKSCSDKLDRLSK